MKVNRDNYEIWIIDYLDGKLTAGQTEELLAFFEMNPDLKEEFENYEPVTLQPERVQFDQKDRLKKTRIIPVGKIHENNYESFFIGWYEQVLTVSQKKELVEFIEKNPHLKREFDLHEQLILKADTGIVFPGKDQLKRRTRKIAAYWWWTAAAAAILLFFALNGLLRRETPVQRQSLEMISKMEKKYVPLPEISGKLPDIEINPQLKQIPFSEPQEDFLMQERQHSMAWIPERELKSVKLQPLIAPPFYQPYQATSDELLALADAKPEKPRRNGLLAKIFRGFTKSLKDKIPENLKEKKDRKEPPMLKVLDNSIMVFNTVTGSDTELEKIYDENGNLIGYRLEGESFSWYKKAAPHDRQGK